MRVLQINSVCGYGSTGRIALDLYSMWERVGHECCIAYGRGDAPQGIHTLKIGHKRDFYMHVLYNRVADRHGFASHKATKQLIREIEIYNPDVIHLHNIHGYYLNIKVLFEYLKRTDKKIIWTLHDCWSFTGHCAHFDHIRCERWKEECFSCPQKNAYPRSAILDASRKNFIKKKSIFSGVENLTIVTPSYWLANLVKQSFLKDYPVKIIHNGIDLDVFRLIGQEERWDFRKRLEGEYRISVDKKIVLGVASVWTKEKGFDDFCKMARITDESIQYILVGINDKQKKVLPKNITGIGRTKNLQEMAFFYNCADVFLNPTYIDTYPTVNLEAIACGTPVITYNTCGSPESVEQGLGEVVERGDYIGMLERMMDFIKRKSRILNVVERKKMSKEEYCLSYKKLVEGEENEE